MHTDSSQRVTGLPSHPAERTRSGVAILRPLLEAAAAPDLDDLTGWATNLRDAADATTRLAAAGELPMHLTVAPTDPPVIATRLIAAAWRHVNGAH